MFSMLNIILIVVCVLFLISVIVSVHKGKLELRYSLLWMILGVLGLLVAVFPAAANSLSHILGFELTSNFVFCGALVFLMAICLSLSKAISKQSEQIRTLTQELALLKKENEKVSPEENGDIQQPDSKLE